MLKKGNRVKCLGEDIEFYGGAEGIILKVSKDKKSCEVLLDGDKKPIGFLKNQIKIL
jgi:hypothetical protein